MADYYLDISAVGNEYQAYADTPTTWAVPQDGNGRAGPGHSAAVAIATIDVAGCSASGTGTIGVLGVTVSSTLNASGAALATAIAAAINASATATAAGVCQALLPLNRLVFARVNPGVNTQVQIMLRIAGTDWNGLSPTQANISPAATIGAFAGGADGPFAYFWNTTAVLGKNFSAASNSSPTWGVPFQPPPGTLAITSNDPIHVRTKRDGVDLSPPRYSSTAGFTFTLRAQTLIFDDGTIWPGDNGQMTLRTYTTAGSGCGYTLSNPTRLIARAKYGLRVGHGASNTTGGGLGFQEASVGTGDGAVSEVVNALFDESLEANSAFGFFSGGHRTRRLHHGCRYYLRAGRNFGGSNGNNGEFCFRYIDCDWDFYIAGPTPSGLLTVNNTASGNDTIIEIASSRFTFASGGPITQLISGSANPTANFRVIVTDTIGVRPEMLIGTPTDVNSGRMITFIGCADSSAGTSSRSSMIDTGHCQRSWIDDGTSPYLNSVIPNGSGWAIRTLIKAGRSSWVAFELARTLTYYRAADAAKVITLELLVPNGVTFSRAQLYGLITFVNAANATVHAGTRASYASMFSGAVPELDASSAAWTNASGYTPVKVSFDTSSIGEQIKAGTEVVLRLMYQGDTPGGLDRTIFVNPELTFA